MQVLLQFQWEGECRWKKHQHAKNDNGKAEEGERDIRPAENDNCLLHDVNTPSGSNMRMQSRMCININIYIDMYVHMDQPGKKAPHAHTHAHTLLNALDTLTRT